MILAMQNLSLNHHRGTKYILDLRFEIVELNKFDPKKSPNLQSTINNLKLHLPVSLWLVIIDYLANSLRIEARIMSYNRRTAAYLHVIY